MGHYKDISREEQRKYTFYVLGIIQFIILLVVILEGGC